MSMENEIRRSGSERRERDNKVAEDKRINQERRDAVDDSERIIGLMKKIPLFKGFADEQFKKIINVCSKKKIAAEHFICREGDNSNELYILLKGKLKVTIRGTTLLNYISPIGLVGEIGVFTDVNRSATVAATTDSTVIKINKVELFKLIESDSRLGCRLFLNVINDLANKLQEDNETIENLRNKKRTRIL